MKGLKRQYLCNDCSASFIIPSLSDFVYGELIMVSPIGEFVYLNSFTDPVFDEVSDIADRTRLLQFSDYVNTKIWREVFSEACDPDSQGNKFYIDYTKYLEKCPFCGSDSFVFFDSDPPDFVEAQPVSHKYWYSLSPKQRSLLIKEKLFELAEKPRAELFHKINLLLCLKFVVGKSLLLKKITNPGGYYISHKLFGYAFCESVLF